VVRWVYLDNCQRHLRAQGKPYPRTCKECGLLGPCRVVPADWAA
jgi:hypothetical protein